jgi:UDP-N-acetyl-D-galactosamine dehydrogenase
MSNLFSADKIGVVGLGYVGLPLAVEFGSTRNVTGFDISTSRIKELNQGIDRTFEVSTEEIRSAKKLVFSNNILDLELCDTYIITVPTPVDDSNRPDLNFLISASREIGGLLSFGNTVIFESTVYPGATEEVCVPLLEKESGLSLNTDFFVGYSPERINPGDKSHNIRDIVKITSGSTEKAAIFIDELYASIISKGTFRAKSIKTAEAAKVIENVQRDVNIALVNDLAILFEKLGLDTAEVLDAAATKWNFHNFRPGLVGGHCIGVDPYYLTFKSQQVGHHPEIILAGRRINDNMSAYAATRFFKLMSKKGIAIRCAKLLVLGFTFKENCPDIRNTKVVSLVGELEQFGANVDIVDPWVDPTEALQIFGIKVGKVVEAFDYDGIVLAVGHKQFLDNDGIDLRSYCNPDHVIFDLKSCLPQSKSDLRL